MFKEVIVVEGRDDTRRLKEVFPEIETFETGGSALDAQKLSQIKALHDQRGVIVFTDPDFPGQKIRQEIIENVPDVKHAYLDKADAKPRSGKGLGVEHAQASAIRKALENAMTPKKDALAHITQSFLVQLGLVGHPESKLRREVLTRKLKIGYVNGKQLKNRLNLFGIDEAQVLQALKEEEG